MLLAAAALALRLELIRHSLTGTHYRYGQYVGGQRIAGAELDVTIRPDGTREEQSSVATRFSASTGVLKHAATLVNVNGEARPAHVVHDGRILKYIDDETGAVIRIEPRYAGAKPARVFLANPVKTLNAPNLQDQNNSATAVPEAAYSTVDLDDVNASGPLGGPFAQIVDVEAPGVAPVDASGPLVFDRSQSGFEDVNAYAGVDRSQKYLQSLGYAGERGIAQYPVPIDTHARNGDDDSNFIPTATAGQGVLLFGDGGTDDAEDPDLVLHEYAHAIHEWIAPGAFLGPFASEGRAISEGFADYWGFSGSYAAAVHSGRDPFCFADWDARCWNDNSSERCGYPVGADCLRRLDDTKAYTDFDRNDAAGTEYLNGVIWSSALREMFVALTQRYGVEAGKRIADTIVIESLFGAPPNPGFAGTARKMIAADRYLNSGANADVICAAMVHRGILTDCETVPRGELTFFQSVERGVPIPDNDPNGVTLTTVVNDPRTIDRLYVRLDADHPFRGDLQIVLVAPDGTQVVLQNPSGDRTHDIRATYGRDALPADSLDALRGKPANGVWKLRVADTRLRDVGTVLSWGLVIQFAGDTPMATRPSSATRQTVPVAGRIHGAEGTFFTTDVRMLNRGPHDVTATLIFTPAGADGRTDFAAANVDVAAGQLVALTDVVGGLFGTEGIGQLEIDGDVVATTRTYTTHASGGTLGEAIAPEPGSRSGMLLPLVDNAQFRTNIGFAETAGNGGTIVVGGAMYTIAAFGHIQVPVTTPGLTSVPFTSTTDVAAYAAVVDNTTGDTMFFSAAQTSTGFLAPAIHAPGAFGTQWTTDVWLLGSGTLTFGDAVVTNSGGAIHFYPAIGAPDTRGIMVAAVLDRAAAIGNDGYRQSVSFLLPSPGPQDIPFVENSAAFRTNIGLMSDVDSSVRVTLFDAAGNQLASEVHSISAMNLDQFPVIAPVVNGRAKIDVLSGRVAAYASVVDHVTGDASFVPAR